MRGEAAFGMVGDVVMDRFRVLERIGSGGMGTVYRAYDERLQRAVAVKEISAVGAGRVLREAQAAARLNHPGIVTLYELGEADDHALLVSELVEGSTLSELARAGALSDREVAELGADLCDALSHAHERGVVHRDIKPQNVIVSEDAVAGRRAKLLDFGIAQIAGATRLTATGEVVGTLAYMAPEQAEGEPATEPADIYALALTLYECWAGMNPVARSTPAATARAIGEELPPLNDLRPDLPARLADVLGACLDPYAEHRPGLDALRHALERSVPALDDRPVPTPRVIRAATGTFAPLAPDALGWALGGVAGALLAFLGTAGHADAAATVGVALGIAAALLHGWRGTMLPALACGVAVAVLAGPDALAGPAAYCFAAASFAPIIRLGHVAVALLFALLWSAGLYGLVRALGSGGIAGPPQLVAALAVVAVLAEFHARHRERRPEADRPLRPAPPRAARTA